jgi:hypothetical protein
MTSTQGLTQVLEDGMYTYLYGIGLLAQTNNASTEYFLGDVLDSARQLTDATGAVILARSYEPYGSVEQEVAFAGVQTAYGFTGEYVDSYLS